MTEPLFAPHLPRWRRALLALIIWTVLGLVQAARLYIVYNSNAQYLISWQLAIAWALADWYIWGALSVVIFAVVRRVSLERLPWYRVLAIHLPAAIVICGLQLLTYTVASEFIDDYFVHRINSTPQAWYTTLYYLTINRWQSVLLTYAVIAAAGYAWRFYHHKRQEELRRIEVEAQLAQAQLTALKARLQPHFLFNTLNAVTALIHSDPQTADRMVSRLSELLRMAIDSDNQPETTLHRELDFVERYLDIQRLRFPERLLVEYAIDPPCRDAAVPSLILQPIVENAVQYAVASRRQGGRVTIAACQTGDDLILTITDDGPGLPGSFDITTSSGVGLASTQNRLARMYAGRGSMRLRNQADGGLEVTLVLPFRLISEGQLS